MAVHKLAAPLVQLRIELKRVKPTVWRRVVVPSNITLGKLHIVIQAAMGWTDSHLHEFEIAGERYGVPFDDNFGERIVPETRVRLNKALGGMPTFTYYYDFGDGWEHLVKVEKFHPGDDSPIALCIGGANACPPEDVGGPWGYADFLAALADPAHPQHHELLEWNGGPFDPKAIDADVIDRRMQLVKL